jgi:hypothetical protein
MVLKRAAAGAGFCSGVVIAPDVVLTAAHCATTAGDLRILVRDASGRQILSEVSTVALHPGFRPNAPKTRERSIDLALIRIAGALPASYAAAERSADPIAIGARFRVAGFGIAAEGNERSAGTLRQTTIAARAPLSSILLWAGDPDNAGAGACTGDSGGPIFAADTPRVVAITVWATGAGKSHCGALTQAALIAPQEGWIASVLAGWRAH